MTYSATDATNTIRQQIAALEKACTDALATPGNPLHDERGLDLYNAGYVFFEAEKIREDCNGLLRDLGMDEDGAPLLDMFGYRDEGLAA